MIESDEERPLLQTEALLSELRRGSQEAFETVFHAYYGKVFALAYRLVGSAQEADDVAQEAFLRLYLKPLPHGREHNLLGWLLRVATNLGYNVLRSRKRRQANEERAAAAHPEMDIPTVALTTADAELRVRATLAMLSERQVQMLLLRQAGLSYAELAITLEVAPSSVGALLARAEQAFRDAYMRLEQEERDHEK